MKPISVLCVLFSLLAGCSAHPDVEIPEHISALENLVILSGYHEPDTSIDFIHESTLNVPDDILMNWFHTLEGVHLLAGFEVDDEGKVFVGDFSNFSVHVLSSEGTYLILFSPG